MQSWLLLGILSNASYAISTSIDKYFMKYRYNPVTTNLFKMFFDGLILLVVGFLFFNLNLNLQLFLLSMILGIITAFSGIIYFTSLKVKEVEIVVPYFQSTELMLIFIGSLILFNEKINLYNGIGIALILLGIYTVLSKDGFQVPKLDRTILLISVIVVLHTIYSLLVKKLLFDVEPINLAIMMYFSTTIILASYILVSKKQRRLFDIKCSKIIVGSFFGALGTLLLYSALFVGNASKVYSLHGLQSVFLFIIASFLLTEKLYWHRLIGTLFIFLGIFFITL